MVEFTSVTADKVAKFISCVPNKALQLDPVPTWLVEDIMSGLLLHFTTLLVNKSLTTSRVQGSHRTVTANEIRS